MRLIQNLLFLMDRSGDNPYSLTRKVKDRYGVGPSQPTLARILDGTSPAALYDFRPHPFG